MSEPPEGRRVWDLPVRIVHWLLVVGVAGSYATNRAGVAYFKYHRWFGYLVLVLAAFRILWGLVGTRHARFANFVRGPRATLGYLLALGRGAAPATPGHNPLGAWMVVFLLSALLAQAMTGLFANDEIFNTGPLAGAVSYDTSLRLTSWHRRLFDWILAAIGAHLLAVAAHRVFGGHDLIRPMIVGRKPASVVSERDAIATSRLWIAVLLIALVVGALMWAIRAAPVSPVDDYG
ncbi:MAG: cytochrome b/b6 domain-containing protein [Pseudomonadota bacterium]